MDAQQTLEEVVDRIDELTGDDLCHELECEAYLPGGKLTEREKLCQEKLSAIYRLAHGWNIRNSCFRVHQDWREDRRER